MDTGLRRESADPCLFVRSKTNEFSRNKKTLNQAETAAPPQNTARHALDFPRDTTRLGALGSASRQATHSQWGI